MGTRNRLNALLEEGARRELSYLDFLDLVVGEEVTEKDVKRAQMRTQMAKFPLNRCLEEYDFALQPSLGRRLIQELETGRYLANATNVLLLGPPGVEKTHLAIGLGRKAINQGYTCRFIAVSDWSNSWPRRITSAPWTMP